MALLCTSLQIYYWSLFSLMACDRGVWLHNILDQLSISMTQHQQKMDWYPIMQKWGPSLIDIMTWEWECCSARTVYFTGEFISLCCCSWFLRSPWAVATCKAVEIRFNEHMNGRTTSEFIFSFSLFFYLGWFRFREWVHLSLCVTTIFTSQKLCKWRPMTRWAASLPAHTVPPLYVSPP